MGYIEQSLLAGESVMYRARLHWVVLTRSILLGSILAAAGIVSLVASAASGARGASTPAWIGLGIALVLAAIGVVVAGIVRRNATEIAVTNRRVLIKTGILSRRTIEVLISKIESIGVDESLLGRTLGFGTVIVRGTGGTPEVFQKIARPLEFRRQVQSQVEGALLPSRPSAS